MNKSKSIFKTYLVLTLLSICGFFENIASAQQEPAPQADINTAQSFVMALKSGDKKAAANLIQFPISREKPLSDITDPEQFIKNYDQFFDTKVINEIDAGLKDIWHSWRGTSIGAGLVWISQGKVIAINTKTNNQVALIAEAKQTESAKLHPIASHFDKVLFECETTSHHIRIHEAGTKIQYFSWAKDQALSSPPKISLNGKLEFEGSGGNRNFIFKNGAFTYTVYEAVLCESNCESTLVVLENNKEILKEVCNPKK